MEIKVTPCEEEQVAECVRISLTSYERIHDVYLSLLGEEIHEGVMGSWRTNKAKTIEEQQKKKNAVVALADGTVAGFVSYLISGGIGHIGNNAVDPNFRGHGIAGHLYRTALAGMKKDGMEYAAVHTGLDDGHAAARRAYQKVGFEKNLPYISYYQKLKKASIVTEDSIKAFREEQLSACKEIAMEAWTAIHGVYIQRLGKEMHDAVRPNWEAELMEELETQLRDHHGFVLLDGARVIGFISYQLQGNLGIIGNFAVCPDCRGRGLGTKMMAFLLSKMTEDGAEYARVSVGLDEGHTAARRVCEKMGFAQGLPSVWYYQKL